MRMQEAELASAVKIILRFDAEFIHHYRHERALQV